MERTGQRSSGRGSDELWLRRSIVLAALLAFVGCDGASTVEDAPTSRLDALRTLPYVSTVDARGQESGTVRLDAERASPGYGLYSARTEFQANLIDLQGRVVHRWTGRGEGWSARNHWDAVTMLEEGALLVIDKFHSLAELDRDSNVVWRTPLEAHHDVAATADAIYVGERETRVHRGIRVRFPLITRLDRDGRVQQRWSAYEHLDELRASFDTRDFLDTVLDDTTAGDWSQLVRLRLKRFVSDKPQFNYFHLNTIKVVPESPLSDDPRFRPGNLVICFRNVHQIAILDRDTFEVLWVWGAGILDGPHQPTFLSDGTILVFDNGRSRGTSRVLAVDPASGEIAWEYPGPTDPSFFSRGMAAAQRLPNGNTLITEALKGRVFEVTPEGEIVWDWLNPNLRGDQRDAVYRMVRFSPESLAGWLPIDLPAHETPAGE